MAGFDNEIMYCSGVRLEPSDAQSVSIMQEGTNVVSDVNHVGDPNDALLGVSANPSSLSHDPVSGFLWLKVTGTGIPTWKRLFATTSAPVLTLTGNSGGAIPPDVAGNINIVTAHTTTKFVGSVNSLTIDYALDVLVLGSSVSSLTSGNRLVGFGNGALSSATSAVGCVGVGTSALAALTTGVSCTAVGFLAGQLMTSASNCTAIGAGALDSETTGADNTAVGQNALILSNGSTRNTAVGVACLQSIGNTPGNTCMGWFAASNVAGSYNTAIGYQALLSGSPFTASYNIALGYQAGFSIAGSGMSNIAIGNLGQCGDNNVIRIGTAGSGNAQQNACFVAGITGVTVTVSSPVGVNSVGQLSDLGFGTAGQVFTSTGPGSSPIWSGGASVLAITSVNHAASPYTVLPADQYLSCQTSTGTITILLPNAPTTGRVIHIKDSNGAAATSNISVTTVGGAVTIDGGTTFTMSNNYASIDVIFTGAHYEVF
jgi:hypothetical protein